MKTWEKAEHNPKGLDVVRVGGSGSGVIKGDQIGKHVMVEVKTTEKKSFRLTTELIVKTKKQAASQGRMAIIRLDLNMGRPGETVAIIPWDAFLLMMERVDE